MCTDVSEGGLFRSVRQFGRSDDKVPEVVRWIALGSIRVVPVKGPLHTLGNTMAVAKALLGDEMVEGRVYVVGILYLDQILGRA